MGTGSFCMPLPNAIGYCMMFYLLAKKLRFTAELRDSISLPDAVAARYGSELSRFLTAVAILLGVLGYLGAQIKALATVLHDILANVEFLPPISVEGCMAIACAVLVFYCVTGGILASVYTDLLQWAIMIVSAILVFIAAMNALDGGR